MKRFTLQLLIVTSLAVVLAAGCQDMKCKVERYQCNDKCGDGLLGTLCQDACSIEYNLCID